MEDILIERLSALTEEERAILAGRQLNRRLYTEAGDFIVSSDRMTQGQGPITVRTHTRYVDFPPHRHNYVEMMLVLRGQITHLIGADTVVLKRGDILLLNKHVTHAIRQAGEADIGVNVILSDEFIASLLPELSDTVFSPLLTENGRGDGAGIYLHFATEGERQIGNLTENLLYELIEYRADVRILERTVSLLLHYLSLKSEHLLLNGSTLPGKEELRRQQILSYLHSHYRTATLSELAARIYLTPPYLSRVITETFGKGFKELLLEERIRIAEELLLSSDLPISSIIRTVGYENESYFHRAFKRITGTTPQGFRQAASLSLSDKKSK